MILGKTNMHEFAYGVTCENPHFGSARNPWDLERIPGGSSGGSAAALAAGLCCGSIGTDTGGSIRIPAALCGVVGFKPGLGRVKTDGVIPLSVTLDFVGPLARSVPDVTALLEPIFVRGQREKPLKLSAKGRPLTLGIPKEFFFEVIDEQVAAVFESAMKLLKKRGHKFKFVSIRHLAESEEAGNHIAWAEATLYHQQAGWFPFRASEYGEDVRSRLEMGTKVAAVDYLRARETREKFTASFHCALEENDLKAYLASDSEDEADEAFRNEPDRQADEPKLTKKELAAQKMREALGLSAEPLRKSVKSGPVGDMQVTFAAGLTDDIGHDMLPSLSRTPNRPSLR